MKKNYKLLILFILIPILLGSLIGLLTIKETNFNTYLPPIIFPIVWTILYTLMGISSYRIYQNTDSILPIYIIQLIFNYLWVFIFFTFKLFLLGYIWIIVLIILVSVMIYQFIKIDKLSAYLQIPYLIWLIIASFLNLMFII